MKINFGVKCTGISTKSALFRAKFEIPAENALLILANSLSILSRLLQPLYLCPCMPCTIHRSQAYLQALARKKMAISLIQPSPKRYKMWSFRGLAKPKGCLAASRRLSLSPSVFRSTIPLVVLELLKDTSNISPSPSSSLKGPQRSIIILKPDETTDRRFERLVNDLNQQLDGRKLPVKPVDFLEISSGSETDADAVLVRSINQFEPKLSELTISGYEMISKSLQNSFKKDQLVKYINLRYGDPLFKGPKKGLTLRKKNKLTDIIIKDIWNVTKTTQVSSLEDILVTESVGLSNLDLFLLLLQNGVIIQHLSGAVSEISFDSKHRKIIFKGTNKQVENAKINLTLDLQKSHREVVNLSSIKHLFREKYNEFSLGKIGKNTEVHFSHLGDDNYELTALNQNQLKRTKRLLLWLLNYNLHIKEHLFLPEKKDGLSLLPYKDDDALSWDNRSQEFFVLKDHHKKPSEAFLKELEKFSDESLATADFDYEDFLEEAKSVPLRRTNLMEKKRDSEAFLLLRSIGINTDVVNNKRTEIEAESGEMAENKDLFSEESEVAEKTGAFGGEEEIVGNEDGLEHMGVLVGKEVKVTESSEKLDEDIDQFTEEAVDGKADLIENHRHFNATEASTSDPYNAETTIETGSSSFVRLSESVKEDLYSKLTDFSYRESLSGVKNEHLNPPVFTVTLGNILFNTNQSHLEDASGELEGVAEKLLPSGPKVESLSDTSNYKFSSNVELISDRVLALPVLGGHDTVESHYANEDPHTYTIQMKFLPSPFSDENVNKGLSEQMKYPPVEIWVDLNQRLVADISSMQVVTVEGENTAYVALPENKVDLKVCCQISGDVLNEAVEAETSDSGDIDSILRQTTDSYRQFRGQPGVAAFLSNSKLDFSGREPTSIERHIDLCIDGVDVRYHYINVSYRRKLHLAVPGTSTPVEFNVVEGGSLGGRKVEVNFIGEVGDIAREAFDKVVDDAMEFAAGV